MAERTITHCKVVEVSTKGIELEKEVNAVINQQLDNGYDCIDNEVISFKVEHGRLTLVLLYFALKL